MSKFIMLVNGKTRIQFRAIKKPCNFVLYYTEGKINQNRVDKNRNI